jgi:hypothetical protein
MAPYRSITPDLENPSPTNSVMPGQLLDELAAMEIVALDSIPLRYSFGQQLPSRLPPVWPLIFHYYEQNETFNFKNLMMGGQGTDRPAGPGGVRLHEVYVTVFVACGTAQQDQESLMLQYLPYLTLLDQAYMKNTGLGGNAQSVELKTGVWTGIKVGGVAMVGWKCKALVKLRYLFPTM